MENLFQLVVPAGADIMGCILDFLADHKLTSVYIIGAIGSAKNIRVAAPVENDLPLRCVEIPFHSSCEIVGFTGEVMEWGCVDTELAAMYPDKDSPLFVHIHVAAASAGGHVFGGGFRGGKAFRSLRIFMLSV
ncbi:putative DNA-binding protein with PD1-like DNA-binding motif [Sphaerochaeta pleomorpha str. Grapes]|uniref:Putative DNA-binding protein with PD1-like DNA-binding motif n=1 Tax=Sphaerochaeta pleomorpha (strain ATCC BAA-1885 / DSM 22778 / Grapes) TaxID=158190 RepID=G8QWZ8_SPHPG|nr:PPC domain-containing DNA-binding protein [Sphaerochaeta pleomorpha]AEV29502.1 putative DNA-binding protein with PD1-like DNA-binding motif [Sphaerochaeta pleomorpha str. Grapes]